MFLNQTQAVVNHWLLNRSFSVGIGDTIADPKTTTDILATLNQAKVSYLIALFMIIFQEKVSQLVSDRYTGNGLEPLPGRTMEESFEARVNKVLNSAVDTAGKSAQNSLTDSNNVKMMVVAGSKGSSINISQMIACVGQQNVEGLLPQSSETYRNRKTSSFWIL